MNRSFPTLYARSRWLDDKRSFPIIGGGAPPITDPLFAYVVLLAGFDEGTDGGSLTVDESNYGFSMTLSSSAQLQTGSLAFGDSSLLLDGAGGYVSLGDQDEFTLGAKNFCMEAWVNPTDGSSGMVISKYGSITTEAEFTWLYRGNNFNTIGFYGTGANSFFIHQSDSYQLTPNSWHHIAFERFGDTYWFYADGSVVGSFSESRSIQNTTIPLEVGARSYHPNPIYWKGGIDEVRITVNNPVARYGGSSYTVPSSKFPRE